VITTPPTLPRARLLTWVIAIIAAGSLATTLAGYAVARSALRDTITSTALPLTSDSVYSEVRKALLEPVGVAQQMATNTFLVDWASAPTEDELAVRNYLRAVRDVTGARTTFFISERTKRYYHPDFGDRTVSANDPEDSWYFAVTQGDDPYQINVDTDSRNAGVLSVFVNYQVRDQAGVLLGITGVGILFDDLQTKLTEQATKFNQQIFFTDATGSVMLTSSGGPALGSNVRDAYGSIAQLTTESNPSTARPASFSVKRDDKHVLVNARFLDELGWTLIVEQADGKTVHPLRKGLIANLFVGLVVSAFIGFVLVLGLRRSQQRLRDSAMRDQLTLALNRAAGVELLDNLRTQMSRSHRTEKDSDQDHALDHVLLLDVDHFKAINDSLGHFAGDEVLRSVADGIRSCIRETDALIRWGGEEFVVVLPHCNLENAQRVAESIRSRIALLAERGDSLSPVTTSIGVAPLLRDGSWEAGLRIADDALYVAKRNGRNQVVTLSRNDAQANVTTATLK
jgi:diguanylate cyclase (GGDEF)-like protein